MKLVYSILIIGLMLMGIVLATFGIQQAVIDTGIVSLLWVIYIVTIIWLVWFGLYCFVQLIRMGD